MPKKKRFLFSLTLLLIPPLWAQFPATSHEEEVVRQAHAKVAFSTQVGVVSQLALHSGRDDRGRNKNINPEVLGAQLEQARLAFALSDFKVGPIAEIGNLKWGEIITSPTRVGKTLKLAMPVQTFDDRGLPRASWITASATWEDPQPVPAKAEETMLKMPVNKLLTVGGPMMTDYKDVTFTRYATYTASYTFEDRRVGPYKAVFFFGVRPNGQVVVSPQDLVFDYQALYTAIEQPSLFYPTGLLKTHLREIPEVRDWVNAGQVSAQGCSAGKGEVCCVGDRCGVAGVDVANEMAAPLRVEHPTPEVKQ